MLRRLRQRRSLWAAIAAGIVMAPALLGGVAAAPAEAGDLLPPPERDPRETPPPDPVDAETRQVLAQMEAIADLAPERFRFMIVTIANRFKVDPRLIAAIITVESEWKSDVVGSYGELGLMQILPSTGKWLAKLEGLSEYDLADQITSVQLGTSYIHHLLNEYGGDPQTALAVYNGGPAAADYAATSLYARKVMKHYRIEPVYKSTWTEHAS